MTPRRPASTVRVVSVSMADGTSIDSSQARERIARALLGLPTTPTQIAQQGVEQAKPA